MENGHLNTTSTIISVISAIISFTMANFQAFISISAGLVAIVSGCMAIRHYYYSTKKIKDESN